MRVFEIAELPVSFGNVGLCPAPGRYGDYSGDLTKILSWCPSLVLTMTTEIELEAVGAEGISNDLAAKNISWRHLPVTDFRSPCRETCKLWPSAEAEAKSVLRKGGNVLVHCYGGCGRSGMAVLRLMIGAGEAPQVAMDRLRAVRPCAVETAAQANWATESTTVSVAAR